MAHSFGGVVFLNNWTVSLLDRIDIPVFSVFVHQYVVSSPSATCIIFYYSFSEVKFALLIFIYFLLWVISLHLVINVKKKMCQYALSFSFFDENSVNLVMMIHRKNTHLYQFLDLLDAMNWRSWCNSSWSDMHPYMVIDFLIHLYLLEQSGRNWSTLFWCGSGPYWC